MGVEETYNATDVQRKRPSAKQRGGWVVKNPVSSPELRFPVSLKGLPLLN